VDKLRLNRYANTEQQHDDESKLEQYVCRGQRKENIVIVQFLSIYFKTLNCGPTLLFALSVVRSGFLRIAEKSLHSH